MRTYYIYYYWRGPRNLWAVALSHRWLWGRAHSLYTKSWNFGPLTIAHTALP